MWLRHLSWKVVHQDPLTLLLRKGSGMVPLTKKNILWTRKKILVLKMVQGLNETNPNVKCVENIITESALKNVCLNEECLIGKNVCFWCKIPVHNFNVCFKRNKRETDKKEIKILVFLPWHIMRLRTTYEMAGMLTVFTRFSEDDNILSNCRIKTTRSILILMTKFLVRGEECSDTKLSLQRLLQNYVLIYFVLVEWSRLVGIAIVLITFFILNICQILVLQPRIVRSKA